MPPDPETRRDYDVALSFAGEDRSYVAEVAEGLRRAGVRVFYDDFEDLWGLNLYEHLQQVYTKLAAFCVVFVSADYASKTWTRHEFEAAQARALETSGTAYVLPVRLDDSELPGLLSTVAYLDGRDLAPANLVDRIVGKLDLHDRSAHNVASPTGLDETIVSTQAEGRNLAPQWFTATSTFASVVGAIATAATLVGLGIAISNTVGGDAGGETSTPPASPSTSIPDAPTTTSDVGALDPPTSSEIETVPSNVVISEALGQLSENITTVVRGNTVMLEGFVANDAESLEAESAVAALAGVASVDNRLVQLEPSVLQAIQSAGVIQAEVNGQGTVLTIGGTISEESDRASAVSAAESVEGVTGVVDALELSVSADLNELPQVQFAPGSAEILPASFGELDAAADLLISAGEINIEVQGYTDTRGAEATNLQLSQDRAESVRTYLVEKGVGPDILFATGFGETEQFGPDFDDNRLVRFQEVD